jgi:hypothetical protein
MEIIPTTSLDPSNFSVELQGKDHGTGDGRLRQIDIHVADAFASEWL